MRVLRTRFGPTVTLFKGGESNGMLAYDLVAKYSPSILIRSILRVVAGADR